MTQLLKNINVHNIQLLQPIQLVETKSKYFHFNPGLNVKQV